MVTIYGRNGCPWCDKAEQLMSDSKVNYVYRNTSTDPVAKEFLIKSGFTTVPQIFDGEKHVGGYEDAVDYFLF